jgi:putative tricarboxylic transport membrane protein
MMLCNQFLATLSPYMLTVCMSGVSLGILWGGMPGLSTTMALALLIGLSAGMKQYTALMFMLGVYTGSVFGGSMLPTLTLGIPGNAAAAAILAALELKNVVVGPAIQIEHPGLIYFIYFGLIIANFLMYGMAIALIKPCVKLFSLPRSLLMPLIIPLCIIGAFAVNLNYFDVYVMLGSGLIGYILHRFGFPLAPLVLAVILGPLADENLRRALLVFQDKSLWYILGRPIGTPLILVVLYTFYDGIFKRGKSISF